MCGRGGRDCPEPKCGPTTKPPRQGTVRALAQHLPARPANYFNLLTYLPTHVLGYLLFSGSTEPYASNCDPGCEAACNNTGQARPKFLPLPQLPTPGPDVPLAAGSGATGRSSCEARRARRAQVYHASLCSSA